MERKLENFFAWVDAPCQGHSKMVLWAYVPLKMALLEAENYPKNAQKWGEILTKSQNAFFCHAFLQKILWN